VADSQTSKSSPGANTQSRGHLAGGSFTDQLAELQARAEAAAGRVSEARRAFQTQGFEAAREVTADLASYRDAITFRKDDATPEADRPARERELTDQFLDAVRERGFVVQVADNGTLRIVDPSLQAAFDEANTELREADRAVKDFKRDHAADIEAERRAADAARIKDALAGDDGDAIREVLAPSLVAQPAPLRSGVHRRSAVLGR
jgi:hypothetical protein